MVILLINHKLLDFFHQIMLKLEYNLHHQKKRKKNKKYKFMILNKIMEGIGSMMNLKNFNKVL